MSRVGRVYTAVLRRGCVLMVRHVHDGRDYWTLPGGGVEVDEALVDAAKRELWEETRVTAIGIRQLFTEAHEVCFVATCDPEATAEVGWDPELAGQTQWIRAVHWFPLAEVHDDRQVAKVLDALARNPGPTVGLRRHTVMLREHDPLWAGSYEVARLRVSAAAPSLVVGIEHVGSTAIRGLLAKPIIDVMMGIRTLEDIPALADRLAPIGAIDRGFINDRRDDYLFVLESSPSVRTHHLHAVEQRGRAWDEYIAFRDRLRTDPECRRRYAQLKLRLSSDIGDDRRAYTGAKASFIADACRRTRP